MRSLKDICLIMSLVLALAGSVTGMDIEWEWTGSITIPTHNQVLSSPIVVPLGK